ncbi:hypothetical protein TREMEDRAFT_58924 [Tremella mesenterica DSM 1558]|uniref:uncharacterized protein n=1 Tax=Tremella mesenterica (strain ATCC 24925 / CBS 8224 / DSM 1558 / NBRC 9311 / NRRL Y-6157 / RJB 2259-6 / UBC 559-6) TaxID=578456 RepID=UPI0003F497A3|nr:uncharacterized protein TREMEDRAFT_58924 [Tremella mesenterica DSM 1558]EIW72756.1 hypothetical protein TREMEDRAFT_58924 [Tremella mesenterica DSM 1558]
MWIVIRINKMSVGGEECHEVTRQFDSDSDRMGWVFNQRPAVCSNRRLIGLLAQWFRPLSLKGTVILSQCCSVNRLRIHTASQAASAVAIYSTSIVDCAIVACCYGVTTNRENSIEFDGLGKRTAGIGGSAAGWILSELCDVDNTSQQWIKDPAYIHDWGSVVRNSYAIFYGTGIITD